MLNSDGKLLEKMDKVTLSNGISWSNDHKSIYYIDSVKRVVYVLDYDIETGNIGMFKSVISCCWLFQWKFLLDYTQLIDAFWWT